MLETSVTPKNFIFNAWNDIFIDFSEGLPMMHF